jgi:hypothetical protein
MLRRVILTLSALICLAAPAASSVRAVAQRDSVAQSKNCVVYVTRTGRRYHRAGCSALRYSSIAVPRTKAIERGYTPCRRCGGSDCE